MSESKPVHHILELSSPVLDGDGLYGGGRWGSAIPARRQAELEQRLQDWQSDPHLAGRAGPFAGDALGAELDVVLPLSGADLFWLAVHAQAEFLRRHDTLDVPGTAEEIVRGGPDNGLTAPYLDLSELHLEGVELRTADLQGVVLVGAHLEGAWLTEAHLEGAWLKGAHLERARLSGARLEGAHLYQAHLEGADLSAAHLEGADLSEAQMDAARIEKAHLEDAVLAGARMDAADLRAAHCERARLTGATFDKRSKLNALHLDGAVLDQVMFDSANLAVVDWEGVSLLGDELQAHEPKDTAGARKTLSARLNEFDGAVRAYRSLAVALRAQGIYEYADRYAYRAQLLQRQVLLRQGHPFRALFSLFLDVLAGHGYKPGRTLIAYLVAILSFGTAYYFLGQAVGPHLSPLGAFVFSMTSFHGRGFFPGGIALDDPITVLAACEAFVGLVIEVSFIATFTQRFFAR